ncbi:Enoyl-CoA hydratase/isomerase [Desulfatibacillum aliphaticivorans]|uniref:Enoyl-CoA hydratase/isomerase n=1 Tax=Desulfatibacillum aliphaticivorans TaxID=218208 RepID=B8FKL9_DESAL|nr:enoyl-CoA hydratase/isomerase family protein [Desulfatibacillum aliphaticivorans]ACL01834.1 Enoyl-CoA hydratase/isomerase [Desulfatibacillum aliphaticivorans]
MDYKYFDVSIEKNIAFCTFNNPPRHTITADGVFEFQRLLADLEAMDELMVFMLTGGNERFFIAHYEVGELASMSEDRQKKTEKPADKPKKLYPFNRLNLALEQSRLITIAAMNGQAHGGGLEIALSCDFRLAGKGKHTYGLPETNVGIIPGAGGTQRLARLLGVAKAMDLILHGKVYSAEEAYDLGVIHRLYEKETFWEEAKAFARKIGSRSPVALSLAKKAIRQGVLEPDFEKALLIEQNGLDAALKSEDAGGAMSAWLKGEKYQWKGR